MQPIEAKNDLGSCAGCGVGMDKGDWVVFHGAGTTHAGCIPRQAARATQTQAQSEGLLFDDMQLAVIEKAKETLGVKRVNFDGPTCLGIDTPRLAGQLARVYEYMKSGEYRTLEQIANATGCLPTSASSRMRDFRKQKLGGYTVIKRQVEGAPLLYEYRLVLKKEKETDGRRHAA